MIIAHRLSTIKNSDLIYTIKNGKVLEQGTHQQLLALNGYYAGLVKSQLAAEEFESKEANYNKMFTKKMSMRKEMQKLSSHYSETMSEISIGNNDIDQDDVEVDRGRLWELISTIN